MQVNANAHDELHDAKRKVESPGKKTQGLRAQMKISLQRCCHDGRHRAPRLTQGKSRGQRKQHDPQRMWGF